ncbi:MAG: nonstructural protein [Microvirus sp.]|nr:MAG: nonstructural protein [Microvirus sp.]
MEIEIYSIKDNKSGFFLKPFDTRGVTDAIRSITEVVNDPKSFLNKFPEDYSLHLLGKLDDMSGVIHTECPLDPPTWAAPFKVLEIKSLIKKEA